LLAFAAAVKRSSGRVSGARGERDDIRADVEQVIMPAL